ncbi:MAG: hypothetical protein IID58_09260 [Proteobacteria bacterium]|nr:hypothetical protein [Pseudomonadota bacterium]
MILAGGLDKTGVMERVAWAILHYGGKIEKQIVSLPSPGCGRERLRHDCRDAGGRATQEQLPRVSAGLRTDIRGNTAK